MKNSLYLSDEALVEGAYRRDRDRFELLVCRWAPSLRRLAEAVLGDPGQADAVVVETFTRVWNDARAYDARLGRVSTWLLAMVHRRALRLRAEAPLAPVAPGVAALGAHGPGQPETDAPWQVGRMDFALRALGTPERLRVVRAYFEGVDPRATRAQRRTLQEAWSELRRHFGGSLSYPDGRRPLAPIHRREVDDQPWPQ